MEKFVKFEEAVEKLGVSADRLNQLRQDGELRAYRDGASWKFRADDIDRLVADGVPEPSPPSDIGLVDPSDLVDASPLENLPELEGDELSLASDDDLTAEGAAKRASHDAGGSGMELELELDDTVTAGASDARLDLAASDEPSDPSDSILLSDEALGESTAAPPSTIIGKSDLESKDADLELVTDDDRGKAKRGPGASEVLSKNVAGSGVLDDDEKDSSHASAFEGLEELELDLAAESGRILSPEPEDVKPAAAKAPKAPQAKSNKGDSDLTLSDVELAGEDEGTDPIPEELEATPKKPKKKEPAPSSDLELATGDDDDFVLAESGGSDITLDSGDSGINLIAPSDSGLALDDIPLEMGGSAIMESLSLGGDDAESSEISLVGSDVGVTRKGPSAKLQTDDDFRLTPLGDREEDGDSSSQVIALDAGMEDLGAGDAGILGGDEMFAEEAGEPALLAEDQDAVADEFGQPAYAVAPRADSEYSLMNILGLGSCLVLLLFGSVLMLDMIRNIWSWDHSLALNDSLLDSLLGLFGLS